MKPISVIRSTSPTALEWTLLVLVAIMAYGCYAVIASMFLYKEYSTEVLCKVSAASTEEDDATGRKQRRVQVYCDYDRAQAPRGTAWPTDFQREWSDGKKYLVTFNEYADYERMVKVGSTFVCKGTWIASTAPLVPEAFHLRLQYTVLSDCRLS